MKSWEFFFLLSSIFLSRAIAEWAALLFGIAYLLVAIYASSKDE